MNLIEVLTKIASNSTYPLKAENCRLTILADLKLKCTSLLGGGRDVGGVLGGFVSLGLTEGAGDTGPHKQQNALVKSVMPSGKLFRNV